MSGRQQIVVLGMMTKMPVAGVVWQTLHYLVGLERLGYETFYVEAHARTPSMLMELPDDDSSGMAAAFLAGTMERFGFGDRWAFHALHDDGRCYGMSMERLQSLYRSAALIINLHGGTEPRAEHIATDRLVFLETDPVDVEIQLAQGRQATVDYLKPHCAYFTFGENYGRPDCLLPVSPLFNFQATRQPVVMEFWSGQARTQGKRYTTIGNWRQQWREIEYAGERYAWSKHHEFLKFLDLPTRVEANFELALGGCDVADRRVLEEHGWRVRDAQPLSLNIDIYREYIASSRGEFTVAKDQNIRLRTGWFSDRAATYLAAGRPVINQDTGFGNALPVGEGLFAFSSLGDIVAAVESIESDYERHARAAREIAQEYFDSGKVLSHLLQRVGMPRVAPGLVIAPTSRRPTTLEIETESAVLKAPLPVSVVIPTHEPPAASLIVVTHNGFVFTRLCLESVLASQGLGNFEVIVVDNDSTDATRDYLHALAERDSRFCLIKNGRNEGFATAVNKGLAASRGRVLIVLNNDLIVPPHALSHLLHHLDDLSIGVVGPVSNEASTEAEIDVTYRTLGELMTAAAERNSSYAGALFDVRVVTMFCIAFRRDLLERIGPLDERFEVGLFEDDDYSMRARRAGYRVVCAEDVLVHHFGEGSFGALVPTGEHARLFEANRLRFEKKWGVAWRHHDRRQTDVYRDTIVRIREAVNGSVPAGARVLVVSRGDEELVKLDGRHGAHFPQVSGGVYAGHHPADSREAIAELEQLGSDGAEFVVIPRTSLWWLDYYGGLRTYLEERGAVAKSDDCVIYRLGARRPAMSAEGQVN